jgi:hypothetical protein
METPAPAKNINENIWCVEGWVSWDYWLGPKGQCRTLVLYEGTTPIAYKPESGSRWYLYSEKPYGVDITRRPPQHKYITYFGRFYQAMNSGKKETPSAFEGWTPMDFYDLARKTTKHYAACTRLYWLAHEIVWKRTRTASRIKTAGDSAQESQRQLRALGFVA